MPKLSLWNPVKKNDYRLFDRTIKEMFDIGGTGVYLHKYLGPKDQLDTGDSTLPPITDGNETTIQDLLFLENRDRKYDKDIYELRAVYNLQDADFDLKQFNIFIENDVLFLEFHMNDSVAKIGRKIMNGDVVELPHLRDEYILNSSKGITNKFYVVEDVNRASSGYSQTWYPHILRVKIKPLTDSQEYKDILDGSDENYPDTTIRDILSKIDIDIGITEAIIQQAENEVDRRNFETAQFYVVPNEEMTSMYPWIFTGDGIPPNGAELASSGNSFPSNPTEGDWFLRTDYEPNVLYKRVDGNWRRREVDYRKQWVAAHRILASFINNDTITNNQGEISPQKQALSKAIKPKANL